MRVAASVDIGATRTKLALVAEDGRVLDSATITTSARGEPRPLVDGIATAMRPLLASATADSRALEGVGVSVAGFLDRERETMSYNANLPALEGFPLRRALREHLALECRLEVDSNAAALAEHRYGAGRGAARLLGVTVGTGLGGGVIVDGALLRHTGECAGDLGHIILDPAGRACTCGARGCLEALVCSAALSARAGGRPVRKIVSAARRGERPAVEALAETGWWLGLGLASLAPLFAPDRIVVGGGVATAGDLLLEPTRASYHEHAAPAFRDRARIVGSAFEGMEGAVGAASLFFGPVP
ncbi:MAG TPA: ROK family protein [Gemmatimonadaceae bacterium]